MAKTRYGYAESSNLKATTAGHIYSIQNDTLPIENGTLWKLGDMKTTDEIYAVTKAAVGDKVVLALSSLIDPNTNMQTKADQHEMYLRKEAGEVARAYEVVETDRFAVGDYMIKPLATTVVAGNYVVLSDEEGYEYEEVASSGDVSAYGFVAKVQKVVYNSNLTIVRLVVVKNEAIS